MANTGYGAISESTIMSMELNSLSNNNYSAASSLYDNTANGYLWADFELDVTFGVAPTTGAAVSLWLVEAIDGTNYPNSIYSSGTTLVSNGTPLQVPSSAHLAGQFDIQLNTTAQQRVLRGVPLPPGKFYPLIQNASGQAFPASGSVLKMGAYKLTTA